MTGDLDPLGFAASELVARGALVERDDDVATAVLPAPLAAALAVPEMVALSASSRPNVIACGVGAPLLDRLLADACKTVPVASVGWQAEPPRTSTALHAAERLMVRNGVVDLIGSGVSSATYLAAMFAWTAEADDRYAGVACVVANGATSATPCPATTEAIHEILAGRDERVTDGPIPTTTAGAATAIAHRMALEIGPRIDEIGAAVARRRDREKARIQAYFDELIRETARPRRSVGAAAIDARITALRAEQTAKLRDLAARYAIRIRIEPIAVAEVSMRVVEIAMRLRRRKGTREIALHVPPLARTPDALACAACPATTLAPALCDDALHVLCETCAPQIEGRVRCPACRRTR